MRNFKEHRFYRTPRDDCFRVLQEHIFFIVWSKVQAALDGLGDDVKDVATKLVNKYKPKIMESLEKVKKMALDGAKSLLLELQGDIVKILKGDEKHLMKRAISDRK